MEVQECLLHLYHWLIQEGVDTRGNIIMPWNHCDTAVDWHWRDLTAMPSEKLKAFLQTANNPMDRYIIEQAIAWKNGNPPAPHS